LALGSFLLLSFVLLNLPVFWGARIGSVENDGREQTSVQRIQERTSAEEGKNDRKKMAAGEYEVYEEAKESGVGPFREKVYDFHESWTLWQVGNREYKVEGERQFRTSEDLLISRRFRVDLSRDLTVTKVTEFASLKWIKDSGPLGCEFLSKEMHCSLGGKNPDPSKDWHIEAEHPYGLLWPISPFSLGSIARESERDPSRATRVSLISIEQPDANNPISAMVLVGDLRYLGVEKIEAADKTWEAYKFSIKVPLHPKYLVWTSDKGLLLALTVEHAHADWPKEGLRLVRFEKWSDF
jgi:hypothetical protein